MLGQGCSVTLVLGQVSGGLCVCVGMFYFRCRFGLRARRSSSNHSNEAPQRGRR